jgi:HEAT repeat protein
MKKHTLPLILQIVLIAAAALAGNAQTPAEDHDLIAQLANYRFGADTAVVEAIAKRVSDARFDPKGRRVVAHELAVVLRSSGSFDVRQFACRQLVFVGSADQAPLLASLLLDEDLGNYALMPLARIPGKAVDDAMLHELPRLHGRIEVAVLDTLANRGDARAMPALSSLLTSPDAQTVAGAASALAKLPDPSAGATLRRAYSRLTGARRLGIGHALAECGDRCTRRGDMGGAARIYELLSQPAASPILRASALRGMVRVHPSGAAALLCKALGEDRTPRQAMAADLARQVPGVEVTRQLSAYLPRLTQRGQLLLIQALADRGDHAAAPAVTAVCKASNGAIRAAAISALGALGSADSVGLLLSFAAAGETPEGEAARDSLVRLRGAGVDAALIAAIRKGKSGVKVAAIQALGLRGTANSIPQLVGAAWDPDPAARAAAFRVLRDLGQPALLPRLVDLLLATPAASRDDAVEAVTEVARRCDTKATSAARMEIFGSRLSAARSAADRISLLGILGQLGDTRGLAALRAGLTDPDADVRMTALSALADWPNDEPINDLLGVVRSPADQRQRAIALRGYLRMIVSNDERTPGDALKLLREVAPNATMADDKRIVLAGAARIQSLDALDFAAGYLSDADVRPEAETAVAAIGQSTAGAYPDKTRAVLEPMVARPGVNEEARKHAAAILAVLAKFGDFIVAWEVSPVYLREGANYSVLFDIPFPPEQAGGDTQVPWRLMPAGTSPDQPWLLDLLAAIGGEQRVAYLRTAVYADTARDLVLELGSDDGVKVWWNKEMVFGHNVARGVSPAEEKVPVHARQGWNSLLLKITQNNMGWGACARATNPDGSPATGLRFAVPSSLPAP